MSAMYPGVRMKLAQYPARPSVRSMATAPPTYNQPHKPMSPHIGFYKSFGRPLAKVTLGAFFVYQLTYLLWTKMETDEECRIKQREIDELEAKIRIPH